MVEHGSLMVIYVEMTPSRNFMHFFWGKMWLQNDLRNVWHQPLISLQKMGPIFMIPEKSLGRATHLKATTFFKSQPGQFLPSLFLFPFSCHAEMGLENWKKTKIPQDIFVLSNIWMILK